MSPGAAKAVRVAIAGAGNSRRFDTERLRKIATGSLAGGARPPHDARGFLCADRSPRSTACSPSPRLVLASFSVDQYKTGERFGSAGDGAHDRGAAA